MAAGFIDSTCEMYSLFFARSAIERIQSGGVAELARMQNESESVFFDLMIIIR